MLIGNALLMSASLAMSQGCCFGHADPRPIKVVKAKPSKAKIKRRICAKAARRQNVASKRARHA